VDTLGDPARLRIEGARVIPPDDVRRALRDDAEFQLASTPSAPLDDLLKTIPAQLTRAYQRAGFSNAKVQVALDEPAQSIVVTVVEGPRYTAGQIIVEGAKQLDAKRLAQATLAPTVTKFPMETRPDGTIRVETWGPPKDPRKPLWNPGRAAPFDQVAMNRFERDVAAEMARQGFFNPTFTVSHRISPDAADLVVAIQDEGPRATLAQIQVNGASRNKPADVLRYLGLSQGMPVDADVLQSIATKLWDSARFWKHTITLSPLPDRSGKAKLALDLDEHPAASLLAEKLNLDEQALLRLRDWLEKAATGQRDIVITAKPIDPARRGDFDFRIVLGSGRGIVAHVKPPKPGTFDPADEPAFALMAGRELGLVMTSNRLGFYDVTAQAKYVTRIDLARAGISAQISAAPNPANSDSKSFFAISAGIKSSGRGLTMDVVLAPICFLDLVHQKPDGDNAPKVKAESADGILAFTIGAFSFRARQDTGEIIEARHVSADAGRVTSFTFEQGALDREADALETAVTAPNFADPQRPLTAILPVLAATVAQAIGITTGVHAERRAAAAAVLARLARGPLADWAERLATDDGAAADDDFDVPLDPERLVSRSSPLSSLTVVVPWCDRLFPRASWPWTLSRETLLLLSGQGKFARPEAARLYRSADTGPLGFLAIAYAYSHLDAQSARIFAKRGLERLDFEHFAKDCQTLVGPARQNPNVVTAFISSLRHLTPEETQAIAGLLPPRPAAALQLLAAHQRQLPKDAQELLPPALQRQLWDAGLKEALEAALTHFSNLD
jgi:hypothetical protein